MKRKSARAFSLSAVALGLWSQSSFAVVASTVSESIVYKFGAVAADGSLPYAGLILGQDGKLYGTTEDGGSSNGCTSANTTCGTVYSFDPATNSEKIIYSFNGGTDGETPGSSLVETSSGDFFGVTPFGGTASGTSTSGDGTLFKISAGNQIESVIHAFTGAPDGNDPDTGVVLAADGNYYGVTAGGGTSTNCSGGCGTIFQLDATTGVVTTVYSFDGAQDSQIPYSAMVSASDGLLYGTTTGAAPMDSHPNGGGGTIFSFDPIKKVFTTLYVFNAADGDACGPVVSSLIQAGDGNLYGLGGCGVNKAGTVYRFNPTSHSEAVLFSFGASSGDGNDPQGALCLAGDGYYYGVTMLGGTNNMGTVFRLDISAGTVTTVYQFAGGDNDGAEPDQGLVLAPDGNLYGTAINVIYKLAITEPPPSTDGSSGSSGGGALSRAFWILGLVGAFRELNRQLFRRREFRVPRLKCKPVELK